MSTQIPAKFGSPSVTTDVVIFTVKNDDLKVLLIKRADKPFKNHWALPGGFLLKKETTHKAAERILREKAGVADVYTEQLYSFDDLKRDPRNHIMTVVYFALSPRQNLAKRGQNLQSPTLFSVDHLPKLAFDHSRIVKYAIKRLRAKLEYTNVVYSLLPKEFTFSQLQKTYETILGRELDKRNFRKKFSLLGLVKPTGKIHRKGAQRPAVLYKFSSRKLSELKKFF